MSISGSKSGRYSPSLSCTENPTGNTGYQIQTIVTVKCIGGGIPRVQEEHKKVPKSYQGHKD